MARLPSHVTNKVKGKKLRGSKTTQHLLNLTQMGAEPIFSPIKELDDADYYKALLWYNTVSTRNEAREYAEKYLKQLGRHNDIKLLKRIPDAWFPVHIGWIGRMALRGAKLKQRTLDAFEKRLADAITKIPTEEKSTAPKATVNIQDRVAGKASELMYELEKMIDDDGYVNIFSAYDWLTKKQASTSLVPYMIRHFKPIADEALEVTKSNCDPQLKECYNNYTKAQLKSRSEFYQKLMADFDQYVDNTKKQRAPRAKKVVTPDKKLKNFNYQKESKEFRLVSINPEKIFDADELWTINTKYKVLTVLRRSDGNSFDISGSSFKNFEEGDSKSYRLGRKFEEIIGEVAKAGKRALGKITGKLKETALQSRSNENTILLKVL